jgi:hypothetical protein
MIFRLTGDITRVLFETPPADGGAGGTGSAPASTPAPSGAPAAVAPGAPAAVAPLATPAAKRFDYAEDRGNWVPPHRIRETSQRAQQLERDLDYERRRVAALSGVPAPAQAEDPNDASIKQELFRLFPQLKGLMEHGEKLIGLKDLDMDALQSPQTHYWESLGHQTLNALHVQAKETLGGGDLTPRAKQVLNTSFSQFVNSDDDLKQRYASQDPGLITEFLKEFNDGILSPYRQSITRAAAPRDAAIRRLPRGGSGSAIVAGRQAEIKPADTDEYHNAAFASFQKSGR